MNSKEQKMRAKDELDSEKELQDMRETFDSCSEQIGLGNVALLRAKTEASPPTGQPNPPHNNPAPSLNKASPSTGPASEADDDTPKTQKTLTDEPRTALQC